MDIKWADDATDGNYAGAESFLGLIFETGVAKALVEKLKSLELTKFKAKDIIRASGLKPLIGDNENVKKNTKKMNNKEDLSPVLLVRDRANSKVIVADGYHRLSAVYLMDEDEWVHCKIL